jgi:adenylate cyclase
MVVAGVVAGLVALRLHPKFRRAVEEAVSRERVSNLFGQHVSPSVVDRLLDGPAEFTGDIREICVMFLDIRNFTENARDRSPAAVVEFLNSSFAFMIEAIDRHGGFINKFLGDGFLAIFGAPLDDPFAACHAVEAAREILAEMTSVVCPTVHGRSGSGSGSTWVPPLPAMSAHRVVRSSPRSATRSISHHASSSSPRSILLA